MKRIRQILAYICILLFNFQTYCMEPKQTAHYETDQPPAPYLLEELPEPAANIIAEYIAPHELQQFPESTFSDLRFKYAGILPKEFIQTLYTAIQEAQKQKIIIYNCSNRDFYIHAAMATALKNSRVKCYFDNIFDFLKMDFTSRIKFDFKHLPTGKTCSFSIPDNCIINRQSHVGLCAHYGRHSPFFDQCDLTVSQDGATLVLDRKDDALGIIRKIKLENLTNTPLTVQVDKMRPLHPSIFYHRLPECTFGPDIIPAQNARSFNHFFPFYAFNNYFVKKTFCRHNPTTSIVNVLDHHGKDPNQKINVYFDSILPIKGSSTNLGITESDDGNLHIIK